MIKNYYLKLIMISLLISGCVPVIPMALKGDMVDLNIEKESVALFVLRTDNQYKPGYPPEVTAVGITLKNENGKNTKFKPDDPIVKGGSDREYLVSLNLSPGEYSLNKVSGRSLHVLILSSFSFPLNYSFILGKNELVYLGKVQMINRKRESKDEIRSGSIFPLIDQSVSGFGGGTFDVEILDDFDEDISIFRQHFPFIKDMDIKKRILKPMTE